MKKDSHSVFFDINTKLQKRLDELEEINYDVCQCTQGFATLNSSIISFFDQLKQIVKDENNLYIKTNYANNMADKNDIPIKITQLFKTKDDFINNYILLSKNLADFISLFACKALCDEYTTSKVKEIRSRFSKITEMKKDINYRFKFNHQNQMIPKNSSNPILIKFNKVKTKLDPSNFIEKISDGSIYNTENLESLNKFYSSLESIKDQLLDKYSSLIATQDDSRIYQKYPSPEMLGNYPEFNKYIKIHSKLKNAFDTLLSKIAQYYVKIHRKQQQINSIVTDLLSLSSKMDKTRKCLEDETKRYANIECLYQKINVIDKSYEYYEFFNPEKYTNLILNFVDEEKNFFKKVDNRIKYSKSQSNESNSTSSVAANDDVESRLSVAHQQQVLDLLTSFYDSIIENINRLTFDDKSKKNIFDQLEGKLTKKNKLETDFQTRYPRKDSTPKQSLVMKRKRYSDAIKSENCAFDCIGADIHKAISNLSNIEEASTSFAGIHNFLKAESYFNDFFLGPASYKWSIQIADEFKNVIKNKKDEIEKTKLKVEEEKKLKDCASCCHPKTICLASCGHTFCDNCLNLEKVSSSSHGICPKCSKEFTLNDIIHIKW